MCNIAFETINETMDMIIRPHSFLPDAEIALLAKRYKSNPNPSTGVFNIELPESFTGHISVLDVTGRVVYTNRIDKEFDSTLDLSAHPGVLFIQIVNAEGISSTHKVMVIK
jgi:hypothetical protein